MATMIRVPITNTLMNGLYTLKILVGAGSVPVNVLLDTGSSILAVAGSAYKPSADSNARTTKLLQTAPFQSGNFTAAVVRSSVRITGAEAAAVTLPGANLAVTYQMKPGTFGSADGIFGLSYAALDAAWQMPADTWQNRYAADQLSLGKAVDLDPYFDQMTEAGLVAGKFAFAVRRSVMSEALKDPSADPLNEGVFVLGGGEQCDDLYTGGFTSVAVVHEAFYNANLQEIRLGTRSVTVMPPAPGSRVASNAIIDSGNGGLLLDQGLYEKVIAMFGAVNPDLLSALRQGSPDGGPGCDQKHIDFAKWPPLRLVLQGSDGTPASVVVAPQDYWQFDSGQRGTATTVLSGDGNMLGGQSNLGLPVFAGHYVVFDRTAGSGHGVIKFATRSAAGITPIA
jgi:hypothetical protein